MPRFFFDTFDGDLFIPDGDGREMENFGAAKATAQAALADMARNAPDDTDQRTVLVSVRNEAGQVVVRVALSLVVEYPSRHQE